MLNALYLELGLGALSTASFTAVDSSQVRSSIVRLVTFYVYKKRAWISPRGRD
jgi:hypothetical protein